MEAPDCERSESCSGCLNDVEDEDSVAALGQLWHKDCFRCSVCDAILSDWFVEKDGMLFCQRDYWARYADCCLGCDQVISGPVTAFGPHRLHAECATCRRCGAPVEGEPAALTDRSHLYCGECIPETPPASHAIRALAVPRGAVTLAPHDDGYKIASGGRGFRRKVREAAARALTAALQLCIQLACFSIDKACSFLALRVGDRVLEIDGAPAHTAHNVTPGGALVADTQLTVEQDFTSSHIQQANNKTVITQCIPATKSQTTQDKTAQDKLDENGKRERLFKRKQGEGGGTRGRLVRRRRAAASLCDKERSSSMSQLIDVAEGPPVESGVLCDLSRARSFRAEPAPAQKVFRAADLILGELLGAGFFGSVYKVTHRGTGEGLVLKQLHRLDDDAQRSFLKEVAVLRSLEHPNVLRFAGVLYKDKRLHLVTEYVPGGTLYQLIQDCEVELDWAVRARLARDVAAGLQYLHSMNVIHRDLNSHNCLVREDKSVVVADFGLARVVQRTSGTLTRNTLRRKRYTVVGNPYWMAPEMMNGMLYDERVDVFSFGIVLCEIIGRVSADPDFLPRRSDFGLNEQQFTEKFCAADEGPIPALRTLAFRCCRLEPDQRPPFEVIFSWLSELCDSLPEPRPALLTAIAQWGEPPAQGIVKSTSIPSVPCGRALGKCVSASHLTPRRVTLTPLSRSQQALAHAAPGYILREDQHGINITRVEDVAAWLEPAPLKRTSPDDQLNLVQDKSRKIDSTNLPAFLRNQSVEGLETKSKGEVDHQLKYCRHHSVQDSDSDDEDLTDISDWYRNVSEFNNDRRVNSEFRNDTKPNSEFNNDRKDVSELNNEKYVNVSEFNNENQIDSDVSSAAKTGLSKNIVDYDRFLHENEKFVIKPVEEFMAKKIKTKENVNVSEFSNEKQINSDVSSSKKSDLSKNTVDYDRFLHDNDKFVIKAVEEITEKKIEPKEKTNFFTKRLMSPKLSRLFKTNESKDITDDKSKSKFFVQHPSSPNFRYRVRPVDKDANVIKTDLKLAGMGKPMTPIFRRHVSNDFADGRFSYRKPKTEPKFVEIGRNKIKSPSERTFTPLIRSQQITNIAALTTVLEKDGPKSKIEKDKKREGISRSNYVSLANLKINGKTELQKKDKGREALEKAI